MYLAKAKKPTTVFPLWSMVSLAEYFHNGCLPINTNTVYFCMNVCNDDLIPATRYPLSFDWLTNQ